MGMRIFSLLATLGVMVASCAPLSRDADTPRGGIKVATWNIEHLAERNGEGCRPRQNADYDALRRYADLLDADVIAFQEVESQAAAKRVFDPAIYEVVFSMRPASRRGGACYGSPGQTIRHQGVGFAIRKDVVFTRNPDLAELGLGNAGLRWGVDVTLHGSVPLRLLNVHLKSGCNSGRAPSDRDCPILFAQEPVLEQWIDARALQGVAFAVLGDWNRRISARGDLFYAGLNDGEPRGAELSIAAGQQAATCKARYREFIDHIVTGTQASRRMVPGSFAEFTYSVPEAEHPSDHCPVSVRFK